MLLDVPCPHPACAGHHNESIGDVCVYCATHEWGNRRYLRELVVSLSSLDGLVQA